MQEAFRKAADPGLTVAVGHAVSASQGGWLRWSDTLRAARTTLELALTVPAAEPASPTARWSPRPGPWRWNAN